MGVANKVQLSLMSRILSETVVNYARARSSQSLEAVPANTGEDTVEIVNLQSDILEEPTEFTQAATLASSLRHVSRLCVAWKRSASLAVHQKIIESWAINVIYHSVGLKVGDTVPKSKMSPMKAAAKQLMPVLRPSNLQATSDQNVLRTQYYWTLLAKLRSSGAAFIVAYRPSSVDSILLLDGRNRLRSDDIPPWSNTISRVEKHVAGWFDALEGAKDRSDLQHLVNQIYEPCSWSSPSEQGMWDQMYSDPAPASKLLDPVSPVDMARYGYHGFVSRRKLWGVMSTPDSQQSIAIANIPEASFLGIVPGVLRLSALCGLGCIPGPCGVWLDTR